MGDTATEQLTIAVCFANACLCDMVVITAIKAAYRVSSRLCKLLETVVDERVSKERLFTRYRLHWTIF